MKRIHLIDQNGIIFGQFKDLSESQLSIYKIENEKVKKIRKFRREWNINFNEDRNELKIKSENRIESPYLSIE